MNEMITLSLSTARITTSFRTWQCGQRILTRMISLTPTTVNLVVKEGEKMPWQEPMEQIFPNTSSNPIDLTDPSKTSGMQGSSSSTREHPILTPISSKYNPRNRNKGKSPKQEIET